MESNPFLEMALRYAGFGWYVFPLVPGAKAPLGSLAPHGFLDASNNSEVITEWWTRCPRANIGIATGASGLVVIDVDTKDDAPGWESWYSLVEKYGDSIGNTVSVETPSGGCHNYYRGNGKQLFNTHNKLGEGIDTRATGGYVVAPPSIHPNGKMYQWAGGFAPDEIDIMTIPSSLEKLLVESKDRTGERQRVGENIPIGSRNETMTSMAGTMRRRGFTQASIEAALIEENAKCNPPLSKDEIHTISKSIAQYEPSREDEHNTDLGHARRLLRLHGHDMRYCDRLGGWFV